MILKRKFDSVEKNALSFIITMFCIVMIIMMTICSVAIGIQNRKQYITSSNEQINIIIKAINFFYDSIDENINNMVSDMKYGDTGFYIISDENGKILIDGSNKENNKYILDSNIKGLDTALEGDTNIFTCKIDGKKYLANSKKAEGTKLTVVSLISKRELNEHTISINLIIISISIITILIISFIIIKRVSKVIIAPIEEAAKYLTEIGQGNFEYEVNPELLKRRDEFGVIINGIHNMKFSLVELIYEIRHELKLFKKIADENKFNCIIIFDKNNKASYCNNEAREYYKKYTNTDNVSLKKISGYYTKFIALDAKEKIRRELLEKGVWQGIIELEDLNNTIYCNVQRIYNSNGEKNTVVIFNEYI